MSEPTPITPVPPIPTPPYHHCLTFEEFDLPCKLPDKQFESFIVGTRTLESTGLEWEVHAQSKPLHVAFLLRSTEPIPPHILDVEAKVQVINSQDIVVQDRQGGAVLGTGYYQMKPSWILWSRLPNQTATLMCKFKIITKDFPSTAAAAAPPSAKPSVVVKAASAKSLAATSTKSLVAGEPPNPADIAKINHIETVYRELLETGTFGNIKIVTNSETIDVHEAIIYSQGTFGKFVNSGSPEGPILEIKDFEEETIGAMVEFLYTGWADMCTEQPMALMDIANVYGVERLQDLCWDFVLEQLSVDSVLPALVAAEKYKLDQERLKKIVDFFLGNLVTVATTREEEYKVFEQETTKMFRKLNSKGDAEEVLGPVPLAAAAAAIATRNSVTGPRKSSTLARTDSKRKSSAASRTSNASPSPTPSNTNRASVPDTKEDGPAAPSQTDVEPVAPSVDQEEKEKDRKDSTDSKDRKDSKDSKDSKKKSL